jgi:hypothetical protein
MAAKQQKADAFLAPGADADEATRVPRSARVIPVRTFEEAVAALTGLGRELGILRARTAPLELARSRCSAPGA